jgi:hypothetical protein
MRNPFAFALVGALSLGSSLFLSPSASGGGCGCCCGRSSAATAATTIKWESLPRISPVDAVVTGEAKEAPAPVEASTKPFFVFVADAGGGDEVSRLETVVLKDERVALGARAFRAVRMTPEDAAKDPLLSKQGKEAVRFVVISADLRQAVALEKNRLSVSATWDAMKSVADKFYAKSLEATVKETRDLLQEYDRIDGERKILAAKQEKLRDKKGAEADLKEVDAKLAQLEERQKKASDRELALWELKPKTA